MSWQDISRVADVLSIVGFFLTIIGLWATFAQARASRKSADLAKEAASEARDRLALVNTVALVSSALEMLEDLEECFHSENWGRAPITVSNLRKLIFQISVSKMKVEEAVRLELVSGAERVRRLHLQLDDWSARGKRGNPLRAGSQERSETLALIQMLSDRLMAIRSTAGEV